MILSHHRLNLYRTFGKEFRIIHRKFSTKQKSFVKCEIIRKAEAADRGDVAARLGFHLKDACKKLYQSLLSILKKESKIVK